MLGSEQCSASKSMSPRHPRRQQTLALTRDLPVVTYEEILAGSVLCYQFSLVAGDLLNARIGIGMEYSLAFAIFHLQHLEISLQISIRDGHVNRCIFAPSLVQLVIPFRRDHTPLFYSPSFRTYRSLQDSRDANFFDSPTGLWRLPRFSRRRRPSNFQCNRLHFSFHSGRVAQLLC